MMEKNKSFSYRLSFKTVLLASILFLAAMGIVAVGGKHEVEEYATKYAGQCLSTTVQDVQSFFSEVESLSEAVARTAEHYFSAGMLLDTAGCYSLLEKTLAEKKSMLGCGFFFAPYVYDKDNQHAGIYVNYDLEKGEGFVYEWDTDATTAVDLWDYFENEFYTLAKETDRPVWLTPYLEEVITSERDVNTILLSTYVYPMHDSSGKFIGVFASDVMLDWVNDKLTGLRPYENSNVFLLDSCMNIICNPLSQNKYQGTIYETQLICGSDYLVDTALTHSAVINMALEDGYMSVGKGRESAYLVFDMMDNGWILGVSSTYSDVYSGLKMLWLVLLALTAVILVLLFLLNKRMIRHITKPIMQFAGAAREITEVKFASPVPIPEVNTNDELEELGNAMSFMQDSAIQYIKDLTTTTNEKERLKSELDVARNIQNQMLCKNFPIMDRGGIFADSIPAREVGGDLYDFFVNGKDIYFILGDVSGKGVPAALLMAITIAAFRAAGKKDHPMEEIVSLINKTFCKSNEDMMFVTLVVGKIDSETGIMDFCNAGHNPMVTVTPDGSASFVKSRSNVACGVMDDFPYVGDRLVLEKGSRLLIYSDGVTEAENPVKDQYGESRLLEWAEGTCRETKSDAAVVGDLICSVHQFTAGADQNDDMTIMSISI